MQRLQDPLQLFLENECLSFDLFSRGMKNSTNTGEFSLRAFGYCLSIKIKILIG